MTTFGATSCPAWVVAAVVLAPALALAEAPGETRGVTRGEGSPSWVAFLHTPPVAQHAEADMVLAGSVLGLRRGERVVVRFRGEGQAWKEVPVEAGWADEQRAVVPAKDLRPPWVEYYVVVRSPAGDLPIFASEEAPRRVPVVTEARVQGRSTDAAGPTLEELRAAGRRELTQIAREAPVTSAALRAQTVTRAPAIVSTLSRAEMEAMGARTLVDVLDRVPGLTVSRDVQGFYRLAVRGIRSDPEVLLLVDGQRIGNLYDGRNLYELPITSVRRVEIIRGPGAALFGAGAFLAVINVVTEDRVGFSGLAGFDTFAVGRSHTGLGVRLRERDLLRVDLDAKSGRGYRAPVVADALGGAPDAPAGQVDDHHRFLQAALRGRHFFGATRLEWALRGIYEARGALLGSFDTVGPRSNLVWWIGMANLRLEQPISDRFRLRLSLDGDLQLVDRTFDLAPPGYQIGGVAFDDGVLEQLSHRTQSVRFQGAGDLDLGGTNTLTFGLNLAWETLGAWDYRINFEPGSGAPLDAPATPEGITFPALDAGLTRRLVIGLFAQDLWALLPRLDLVTGVRGDIFVGGVGRPAQVPPGRPGSAFAVTPRAGLVFQPADPWTFKALFATAFRVPTFEELTALLLESSLTRGQFEGNPALDPVHIQTAEVSAEHRLAVGKTQIRLRANAFYNRFTDRIEAVDQTGVVNRLENRAGAIRVVGAEGGGRVDFSARDHLKVSVAWFRGIDTSAAEGRNLLTDTPQLKMVMQADVGLGPLLDLEIATRLGSERRNNTRTTLEALHRFRIPPYALVDVALRTRPLGGHVVVEVVLRNALDVPYQDDVPRPDRVTELLPGPGIGAELTVRGTF